MSGQSQLLVYENLLLVHQHLLNQSFPNAFMGFGMYLFTLFQAGNLKNYSWTLTS